MAETTSIGWTATVLPDGTVVPGATFNPFIGCTPWSVGCQACYARTLNNFHKWVPAWGKGQPRKRTSAANWRKPLKWAAEAVASGIKKKIFGDSLCDFLDDEAPMQWKLDYFDLIDQCGAIGGVEFLLLTKRSENLNQLPAAWLAQPPSYVRIGVTAENQAMADKRIPELLRVWKGKNFISVEPMLGPVTLAGFDGKVYRGWLDTKAWKAAIHWVVAGAESGPGARSMDLDWARSLRDECVASGVPYFLKQAVTGGKLTREPQLDGVQWLQFPEEK
jgi:protein gp37